MRDHNRRLHTIYIRHWRPLAIGFRRCPGMAGKTVFRQPRNIALPVKAVPIADACMTDGGFKPIGLRDRPESHESTVAAAHDYAIVRISNAFRNRSISACHNIFEVTAAPIADIGDGELMAVSR